MNTIIIWIATSLTTAIISSIWSPIFYQVARGLNKFPILNSGIIPIGAHKVCTYPFYFIFLLIVFPFFLFARIIKMLSRAYRAKIHPLKFFKVVQFHLLFDLWKKIIIKGAIVMNSTATTRYIERRRQCCGFLFLVKMYCSCAAIPLEKKKHNRLIGCW